MSDEPEPAEQREWFGERLRGAGVSAKRFNDVHDTAKGSTDHTQHDPDDPSLTGNYGVYAGPGGDADVTADPKDADVDDPAAVDVRWLVDVDVDDYEDAECSDVSTEGLDSLPNTFTIESPHTDGESGGHRYYAVEGHVAVAIDDRFGVKNPSPDWGEIRVYNQYCVGPGSQISPGGCVHDWCDRCTGCDKDWCDECAEPDGGYYRIADDREIATLSLETFIDAVAADYEAPGGGSSTGTPQGSGGATTASTDLGDYTPDPDAEATGVIRANTWIAEYLSGLLDNPDRSEKDFAVCRKFIAAGVPEDEAKRVMENSAATKVGSADAASDYWSRTWSAARGAEQAAKSGGDETARSDGGTTTATTPATASESESTTDAASPDSTDDEDGEGDETLGWGMIRELYRSNENGTTGEANQAAALRILDDFDLVTVEENDTIWRYDPETGTFSDDGLARIRNRLTDGLNHTYSRSRVSEILHRIRSETYVKRDTLGAPEGMVCVENGVLDLSDPEDPELLDHSPEYRFTWAMNAPYDPDTEAPMFRQFLGESVRPEDIPKLQEYAGDALRHWKQPGNLCVLIGPTDAGKGVFMRVLRSVFGEDNVASETLHDLTDTRWGAHSLLHRPINLANELSTGSLDNPERAKNFSGDGDAISAEDKGESKFEMRPTANHLFATNQVPQVSNADPAFYNRWLFVTFPTTVPPEEQDDTLDTRMTESDEERAGILNWLIEGYARRQSRTGTSFDAERSIAEKEDMWAAYGNSVDRFISTCVTTDGATNDDAIAKKDAYAVYKTMCNAVGVSVESQRKLTAELKKEEGVGDSQRKVDAHFDDRDRAKVYTGIRYTDDGEGYLNRALDARQSAEAQAETDDQQTGLDDTRHEVSQQQAIRALVDTIDDMTDDGRGDPVPIDAVIDNVVHADDRARNMIRNLIDQGTLREEPEGHVLRN